MEASSVVGLTAMAGGLWIAVSLFRWSLGGGSDNRPSVDEVYRRIRRTKSLDTSGAEGASSALYRDPERQTCEWCDALVLGAHHCPERPLDAFDEAFEQSRGRLATVRSIRRAS
jgi:hypothetical protein